MSAAAKEDFLHGGDERLAEISTDSASASVAAVRFAELVGCLKTTPRTGWVRRGVPRYESVADHSWRVAVLALLLGREEKTIDVGRCMQLAIVHDLAECVVGDIVPGDNISKQDKQRMEHDAVNTIAEMLREAGTVCNGGGAQKTSSSQSLLMNLVHEYEDRATEEAVAVKDLDLLDMILQAKEYEARFGVDLTEFFDGTPVSRFRNPTIAGIAAQVHRERQRQLTGAVDEGCVRSPLTKSDQAFLEEYSKASDLDPASIQSVVQALRNWDSPRNL
jgi:putative hydrolases of HD superfamily